MNINMKFKNGKRKQKWNNRSAGKRKTGQELKEKHRLTEEFAYILEEETVTKRTNLNEIGAYRKKGFLKQYFWCF